MRLKDHKLLSWLLVVLLLVSLLPTGVLAAEGDEAQVGETTYATLEDAVAAATDGGKVTLLADVELTAVLNITKNITIDLNNKTITGKSVRVFHVQTGTLKLIGTGTVTSIDMAEKDIVSSVIRVGDNAATAASGLEVGENVTIKAPGCHGISVFGKDHKKTVVVAGTVDATAATCAAITGNGTAGYGNTDITVKSTAKLSAVEYTIYHPQEGKLTIEGGTFEGGIEAKSGNTEIVISGNPIITAKGTVDHTPNGNGASTQGYAIALAENSHYSGSATMTVQGGTFIGPVAIVKDDTVAEGKEATLTISGGIFSEAPNAAYLAADHYVYKNADDKFAIRKGHKDVVFVAAVDATCKAEGNLAHYLCKDAGCGKFFEDIACTKELASVSVPVQSHTYELKNAVAASCKAKGYTGDQVCSVCGDTVKGADIAMLDHTYDDGKVTTAASCTAAGVKTFTCAGCGNTYTEAVSAAGHTVVTDPAVAATYTATGLTEGSHCSVCEAVIVAQKVVPMLVEVKNEVAAVPDENVNVAIDSAKEEVTEGKATVTLDVVSTAGAAETVKEAEVTAAAITTVLEMTKAEEVSEVALQVELSEATVTLDAAALEHIAEKSADAATVTISVEKVVVEELPAEQKEAVTAFTNPVVISAEVLVDGVKIASEAEGGFNGGKVTVAIPFEAEEGTALSEYTIIYIDDAGKLSIVETSVVNGKLVAALEHLSEYAVVLKTEAKEIVEQEAAEEQKPSGVAPTNDGAQFGLWIALMAVAGAGLFLNKRSAAKNDR